MSSLLSNPYIYSFLISMVPIIELRGGIPISMALGLDFLKALPVCWLGNVLPVPFIMLLGRAVIQFLIRHNICKGFFSRLIARAEGAASKMGSKTYFALFLFVAVPAPGTGAWTGTLAASILDMDFKSSVLAVMFGVLLAGIIMMCVSFGVFGIIL